jgi:MFS family permease
VDLDLHIEPRYSLIVLIFFIPYVLFQPPATVVLRKLGPRTFLSAIVLLWGACTIVSLVQPMVSKMLLIFTQGIGFVKDWKQMLGLRILLGVLEAGFFPGCAYLLSTWYTRYELRRCFDLLYLYEV